MNNDESARLLGSQKEENKYFSKSHRQINEFHNKLSNKLPKISSINDSFKEIDSQANASVEESFNQVEGDKRNFSGYSFTENGDEDFDDSEPRLGMGSQDSGISKSRESNSNDQTLSSEMENSKHLPNEKTSSSNSSSKTTLGFLNEFCSNVVDLIKYRNMDKLEQQLMKHDDVYGPLDSTKKTILHYACEFNSLDICKMIVKCLFKGKRNSLRLTDWVNKANTDGLTSIHFAAYRGNNDLINYLVNLGADVHALDNDGHN